MDGSVKGKTASGAGAEPRVAPQRPKAEGLTGGRMNAEQVLNRLMEGNKRYMAGELKNHDIKGRREATQEGQKPIATVVACSDSRVKPDAIFDTNMETIFDIQTAGNVVDDIAIGSIEYAVAHLHTPVVMVLGHEKCGAVTAAYDDHKEGFITAIVDKIKPGIAGVERTDDKAADVVKCAAANVKAVMAELMERSEIIRNAVEKGETKLVGAMYHLSDGHVELTA